MQYGFKRSFDRSYRSLDSEQQLLVDASITRLKDIIGSGKGLRDGLGLKKIGKDYWEIRAGLSIRVLFQFIPDGIIFYFVGNHNEIERFIDSA